MGYIMWGTYYTDTFSIPASIQHLLDDERVIWVSTHQGNKRYTARYQDFDTRGWRLPGDGDQIGLNEQYWSWEYYC